MSNPSKYFTWQELRCKDGTPVPDVLKPNAIEITGRVDKLRELIGTPLQVNSGYRTPAYNTKVGGEKNSYHMKAMALDIRSFHWNPSELKLMYEGLIRLGVVPDGGIGVYDTFIHLDCGPAGRRWNG